MVVGAEATEHLVVVVMVPPEVVDMQLLVVVATELLEVVGTGLLVVVVATALLQDTLQWHLVLIRKCNVSLDKWIEIAVVKSTPRS